MKKEIKYNLIVNIKELLLETKVTSIEELFNNVSLNASKVMRLIYNSTELEEYFNNKIEEYSNLKKDIDKYFDALDYREKQLEQWVDIDFEYTNLRDKMSMLDNLQNKLPKPIKQLFIEENPNSLNKEEFNKSLSVVVTNYYLTMYNEFTISNLFNLVCKFKENEEHFAFMPLFDGIGIFNYIEEILTIKGTPSHKKVDREILEIFTNFDSDDYNIKVCDNYDFYYLYNSEKNMFRTDNELIYLYVSYRTVLYKLLEYIYTIDLSEEEKQEFETKKKSEHKQIYFDDYEELATLQPAERRILTNIINANGREDNYSIRGIISKKTQIKKHFKDLGLLPERNCNDNDLIELFKNHKEWFTPKVNKSN